MDLSPAPSPSVAAILSGKSRTGAAAEELVRSALGLAGVLIATTSTLPEFRQAIQKARSLGVDQIWVGGGDGSIRLAAKELVNSQIPIGILPLGTGNSLARELEIPLRLEDAMDLYLHDPAQMDIDVGCFGDEFFVNVATIGLTTDIAKELQTLHKGLWGRLAYVPAMFRTLQHCVPFWIEIQTPQGSMKGRVYQFVAASGRLHGGPFPVTEHASIVDGKLSLYAVRADGPLTVLRYLRAVIVGRHTELENVWTIEASEAKVSLRRPRHFVIDGDRVQRRNVTLGIEPSSLRVLVPKSEAPSERK